MILDLKTQMGTNSMLEQLSDQTQNHQLFEVKQTVDGTTGEIK